jgi:hypothetical protein
VNEIDHPAHYNAHPSGVECIEIVERLGFCPGNAIKCLWRADHKGARATDLKKALWYVERALRAPTPSRELSRREFARFADLVAEARRGFEPDVGEAIHLVAFECYAEASVVLARLIATSDTVSFDRPSPPTPSPRGVSAPARTAEKDK